MVLVGGAIPGINTVDVRKKLRYIAVAAAFMPLGQGLIQVLGPCLHDYTTASLLAAGLVTVPNYFANRHFVWRDSSAKNVRNQVLVFWVVVMMAVLLATSFTYLVDEAMANQTTAVHGALVLLVQLFGFGIVWVGRFVILDRWFFKAAEHADHPSCEPRRAISA